MDEVQSIISTFLRTELTNIPVFFREIFQINYNNALCNAFTWLTIMFVLFYILFHKIIREILKYWKYPAYLQTRVIQSFYFLLAYLGYFVYFLYANKELNWKELLGYEKDMLIPGNMLSNEKLIAYSLIGSFQLSQIFICSESFYSSLKFAALAAVCIWAYILRLLEVPFFLAMLVALTGIAEELCKLGYSLVGKEGSKLSKLLVNLLFISAIMLFLISYGLLLHLAILIPAIKRIIDDIDFSLILLCFLIFFWLVLLVWKSILLKYYYHRISHNSNKKSETEIRLDVKEYTKNWNFKDCSGNMLECALFPPRTDDGFRLAQFRLEMQHRKEQMIAKRKPKNKNMIIQTLKCMLVIKQKLKEKIKEKRESGSEEESDEEVEDSDDNDQDEECSNYLEDEKKSEMQKSGKDYKFNETGEIVGDSEDLEEKEKIPPQANLEDDDDDNGELEISNENLDPISTDNIATKSSTDEKSKVCSNAENCKPINK